MEAAEAHSPDGNLHASAEPAADGRTRATLGAVREREQRAFLEAIGYPDAPARFLRHPDYRLPEVPPERLVGEVEAVLAEVRPQVVVSFGPDGLTSHHDHVRAGEAAAEAFRRARAAAGEPADAFQRLYQAAYPRSAVDRFYAGVRRGGFDYGEEGRLRIDAVAHAVLRVRYAPGFEVRDGGDGMLVGAPPPPAAVEVAAAADRVTIRTPAMTAVATLAPYRLKVRGAGGRVPRVRSAAPTPATSSWGTRWGPG